MKAIFTVTTALLSNLFLVTQSYAALVTINVSGQINFVDGTYSPDLTVSDNINAVFVYDTDEAQATSADTAGSTDPGHEYTSFYEFSTPPYGGTVTHVASGDSFNGNLAAVVVNDNLSNGGSDLNNLIPAGTYDWIEILGSTTVDGPNGYPVDGEGWTLALFSSDTSWITDGTLIPNNLPSAYTAILVGQEFGAQEGAIGSVIVEISSVSVVGIPEPSSALLLSLGCLSFALRRSRH